MLEACVYPAKSYRWTWSKVPGNLKGEQVVVYDAQNPISPTKRPDVHRPCERSSATLATSSLPIQRRNTAHRSNTSTHLCDIRIYLHQVLDATQIIATISTPTLTPALNKYPAGRRRRLHSPTPTQENKSNVCPYATIPHQTGRRQFFSNRSYRSSCTPLPPPAPPPAASPSPNPSPLPPPEAVSVSRARKRRWPRATTQASRRLAIRSNTSS